MLKQLRNSVTLEKCDTVHNWLGDNAPDHANSQSIMTTNIRWLSHPTRLESEWVTEASKSQCLFKPWKSLFYFKYSGDYTGRHYCRTEKAMTLQANRGDIPHGSDTLTLLQSWSVQLNGRGPQILTSTTWTSTLSSVSLLPRHFRVLPALRF